MSFNYFLKNHQAQDGTGTNRSVGEMSRPSTPTSEIGRHWIPSLDTSSALRPHRLHDLDLYTNTAGEDGLLARPAGLLFLNVYLCNDFNECDRLRSPHATDLICGDPSPLTLHPCRPRAEIDMLTDITTHVTQLPRERIRWAGCSPFF